MLIDLERGEGRKRESEKCIAVREKYQSVASRTYPDCGLNQKPRHVPCPGIKPTTY